MARKKVRMTAIQRREQLIEVAQQVFAEQGFEATTVEEIAARADVSKPVVYEHFGGKEGLYAVIVDRGVRTLLAALEDALHSPAPARVIAERAALALLDFIEEEPDTFRILVRDVPANQGGPSFSSVLGAVAMQTETLLGEQFERADYSAEWAPMYAQMLVGSVAQVGQWWLEAQEPSKHEVAAHVVNLTWYGMKGLRRAPTLRTSSGDASADNMDPDSPKRERPGT